MRFYYASKVVKCCISIKMSLQILKIVLIPMTVLGGLQFERMDFLPINSFQVSIPMTVLGGLQYCAPEPLGLLAPDE